MSLWYFAAFYLRGYVHSIYGRCALALGKALGQVVEPVIGGSSFLYFRPLFRPVGLGVEVRAPL